MSDCSSKSIYRFVSAKPEDISWFCQMEKMCHCDPWSRQELVDELRKAAINRSRIWIIKSHERPVGYIAFRLLPDELYVLKLSIHPEFRRKGLGKRLIDEAAAFARRRRLTRIILDVWIENAGAIAFYITLGFYSQSPPHKQYKYLVMQLPLRQRSIQN